MVHDLHQEEWPATVVLVVVLVVVMVVVMAMPTSKNLYILE